MEDKRASIRKPSPIEDLFKQIVDQADSKEESNPYRDKIVTIQVSSGLIEDLRDVVYPDFHKILDRDAKMLEIRHSLVEATKKLNLKDVDIIMDEFYKGMGKEEERKRKRKNDRD